MAKTKAKRLLSLLLSLAMVMSLVVTPVYAADDDDDTTEAIAEESSGGTTGASKETQDVTEKEEPELDYGVAVASDEATETYVAQVGDVQYTTLASAIDAAESGATVTLLSDVSVSSVSVSKNLTIDLDNHTLTTDYYVYVATSGVTVTVKNGTVSGTYAGYVTDGTLIFDTCTLSITNAAYAYGGELKLVSTTLTSTSTNRAINCYDSSTVTIDANSTVNCTSGTGVVIWGDGSGESAKTPTLNVYGKINAIACISGNGTDYSGTKINLYSGAVLTATQLGMYLPQPCTVNITGATVTGACAIGIKSGTLTISGSSLIQGTGSYDADLASTTNGINIDGSAIIIDSYSGYAGDVTVTIKADDDGNTPTITSTNAVAIREISNSTSTNVVSISISAGTVTGGTSAIAVTTAAEETISITGGTYSSDVSSYVDSTSYTTVTNSDGTTSVYAANEGAVAAIGSTTYTSLSAAFSAVTNGQTIKLLDNVTDTSDDATDNGLWQVDGKAVTLDLNSKTLTSSAKRMFGVLNAGSLTVKNGSVTSTYTGSDVTMIITRNGSTFAAEGVTFNAANHSYLVYAAGSDTVSLTTCTVKDVSNAVVKDNSTTATITLKGCTYTKTPIVGTNVDKYTIIINGDGGSITSESGAPEIDSSGLVRLDFNYIVEAGGTISTTGTIYLRNDSGASSLTVDGGTVSAAAVEVRDTTTLTANGGTLTVSGAVTVKDGGTLVISDTEEAEDETEVESKVSAASITVNTGAAMTVSGGELTVSGSITVQTVESEDDIALTISGGTISVGQIYSLGSISMTGGTVTSSSSYDNGAIYAKSGSISISGGAVTVTGTRGVVIDDASGTISGGTFTATSIGLLTRGSSIAITGGTYTATTGLYTKSTSVLGDYSVFDTNGDAVTATSSGEYKSTLENQTVVVGSGVAEVNGTKYGTLQAAINAASSTDTVKMLTSVAEDITVASGKEVTLDLAGYTLTNVASDTITVQINATLTITDSSEDKTGEVDNVTHAKAAIYNNGTVTLSGGTYTRSLENGISSTDNGGNSFYVILNHGTMTINSGVTVSQDGHYSSMIENGYQSYSSTNARSGYVSGTNAANPTLTINGGTFTGGLNTVKNDDGATLEINGGTFTNTTQAAVLNWNVATINGGTFVSSAYVILTGLGSSDEFDQGVLNIKDGSFTAGDGYKVIGITSSAKGTGTITITGGSYSDNSADTYLTGTSYQLAQKGETSDEDGPEYYVTSVIVGKNIDLASGVISLNIYVNGDLIDSVDDISMSPYDATASGCATFSTTSGTTGSGAAYSYVVTQDVVAKKMADTLTVTVNLKDGYVVTYETSVMAYANELLETLDADADANTIAVVKAMLNYGAAAQTYSGYNTETLANKGNEYTEAELSAISPSGTISKSNDDDYAGTTVKSASMTLNADFTINLTYKDSLESGYTVSVTCGGTAYTDVAISGTKVVISGLSALDLNKQFVITLTYDSKTYTVTMDGLYYAYLLSQQSNSTYVTLGRTIYQYATTVKTLAEAAQES